MICERCVKHVKASRKFGICRKNYYRWCCAGNDIFSGTPRPDNHVVVTEDGDMVIYSVRIEDDGLYKCKAHNDLDEISTEVRLTVQRKYTTNRVHVLHVVLILAAILAALLIKIISVIWIKIVSKYPPRLRMDWSQPSLRTGLGLKLKFPNRSEIPAVWIIFFMRCARQRQATSKPKSNDPPVAPKKCMWLKT